jgi:hypothetical protein
MCCFVVVFVSAVSHVHRYVVHAHRGESTCICTRVLQREAPHSPVQAKRRWGFNLNLRALCLQQAKEYNGFNEPETSSNRESSLCTCKLDPQSEFLAVNVRSLRYAELWYSVQRQKLDTFAAIPSVIVEGSCLLHSKQQL